MSHRIREAMRDDSGTLMGSGGGVVEADETFLGGKPREKMTRGRAGTGRKMKVLSLVERGGAAKSFHVPDIGASTLKPILKKYISKDARLMTDGGGQYWGLDEYFAEPSTVNHGQGEYVRDDVYINSAEGYFGIMKRGITGIYQHVSKQHLQRYCAEFDHRFTYRTANGYSDAERTDIALRGIGGKRLTYRMTFGRDAEKPR